MTAIPLPSLNDNPRASPQRRLRSSIVGPLAACALSAIFGCAPPPWSPGGVQAYLGWSARGVRFTEFPPDSASSQAGVLEDDMLVSVDGKPIAGLGQPEVQALLSGEVGSLVRLGVRRGERDLEFVVRRGRYAKRAP